MPLPRLSTLLGGLLLSRRGRSMAARHAGKIALAAVEEPPRAGPERRDGRSGRPRAAPASALERTAPLTARRPAEETRIGRRR